MNVRRFQKAVRGPLSAATAALLLLAGCRRDEITHYRVAREAAAPAEPAGAAPMAAHAQGAAPAPAGAPAGMAGDVPPPPRPTGAGALKWKLPKGWTEAVAGGVRYATLKPSQAGKLDVSVVVLPGPAGGELANVNRWRNQIGLGPVDDAALAKARKPLKTPAGPVNLYDFTSEGQARSRMVAGILATDDGNTWFVKMVGDEGPVASARPDFLRLLETLHLD